MSLNQDKAENKMNIDQEDLEEDFSNSDPTPGTRITLFRRKEEEDLDVMYYVSKIYPPSDTTNFIMRLVSFFSGTKSRTFENWSFFFDGINKKGYLDYFFTPNARGFIYLNQCIRNFTDYGAKKLISFGENGLIQDVQAQAVFKFLTNIRPT